MFVHQGERLIPLTAVPALLAERGFVTRYGRTVALRTVQGWAARGELETTPAKRGGVRHTTMEAIDRMLSGEGGVSPRTRKQRRMTPKRRTQAHADADAECEAMGF